VSSGKGASDRYSPIFWFPLYIETLPSGISLPVGNPAEKVVDEYTRIMKIAISLILFFLIRCISYPLFWINEDYKIMTNNINNIKTYFLCQYNKS
jgi:hypothetical protein